MPINPIQTAIAGPGPNSSWALQFGSNVTTGDLVTALVWSATQDQTIYTSSTTITVPDGCTVAIGEAWGAGGGGGSDSSVAGFAGGGGGGGGCYGSGHFAVAPGDSIVITVGSSGITTRIQSFTGNLGAPSGSVGGDSTGSTVGAGGSGSTATFAGAGLTSTVSHPGAQGGDGSTAGNGGGGGGAGTDTGSGTVGNSGGTGGSFGGGASGSNGTAPGGAGGGGVAGGGSGGIGADGQVRITWIRSVSVTDDSVPPNVYTPDVQASQHDGSSLHYLHTWIFRTVIATGGNRPTITADFGSSGAGILQSGLAIAEYSTAGSPVLDTTASGTNTSGSSTATLTTGNNSEVVIALWVSEGAVFTGTGWTSRFVWSGTFAADGRDQTAATSGATVSALSSSARGALVYRA